MAVHPVVLLLSITFCPVLSEVLTESFVIRLAEMEQLIQEQKNVTVEQKQLISDLKQVIEDQREFIERQERMIDVCTSDVYFKLRVLDGQQFPPNSIIVWGKIQDNIGEGYNTTTGKFVSPYGGTYCFTVTVGNVAAGEQAYMNLKVNGVEICRAFANGDGGANQAGLCSRVVRLAAGEEVWAENPTWSTNDRYFRLYTAFEGFMIHGEVQ